MTESAFIHKCSKTGRTKCFCRNSNFYKGQILVVYFGNVGRVNMLLDRHNFKTKDAPNGNVISSLLEKQDDL